MISEKEMTNLPLPEILKRIKTATLKKVQIPFSVPLLERIFRYVGDQFVIKQATYTIEPNDANAVLLSTDAVDKTVIIDADRSIPELAFVDIEKHGAGTITVQVPVGVTLNNVANGSVLIDDDTAGVRIRRISYNAYTIIGNFT